MKQKILIATTNLGKYKEIIHLLGDLPFNFLSLADISEKILEPEETGDTLEANAILKAKYYADKTGLITISEDTGLFVDALDGWPGLKSARVGNNDAERKQILLEKMKNFSDEKRTAKFMICAACYNPDNKNIFLSFGTAEGKILKEEVTTNDSGFGYDPLFFTPELNKTFSEITVVEKNSVSHRSKAFKKMAYYLNNEFGAKHIVVPVAVIIDSGKFLLAKRYDPHNPKYHGKWELSGGIMEMGETIENNLTREIKEELGYDIEILEKMNYIHIHYRIEKNFEYQVYLIPVLCKIIGGEGKFSDGEVMEIKWIYPDEYVNYDYIADNKKMLEKIIPELKEKILKYEKIL